MYSLGGTDCACPYSGMDQSGWPRVRRPGDDTLNGVAKWSRAVLRPRGTLLLVSLLVALSLSCQPGTPEEPIVDPAQSELRTAIAGAFNLDELKVEFATLAVRVARSGCAGVEESLSGEPSRVLISLTNSAIASKFISSDGKFQHGPGGIGSVPVLVIAVEGQSKKAPGEQAPTDRSFIFVETVADPDFTTCTIEDTPLLLEYTDRAYGSFEFELIELPQ